MMVYTAESLERNRLSRSASTDPRLLRELADPKGPPTPYMVLSRSAVAHNYGALKAALPRVDIHYAVKPNSHDAVLKAVFGSGGNFDVCSATEIRAVGRLGVDPETLIHSHPIKAVDEFDYAVGIGLNTFVVDNKSEIDKLRRYTTKKLRILVRFRIPTNQTAVVNLQYKFGCVPEDVLPLARMIEESGHEFYGLCFHIGSQCVHNQNYVKAISASHDLVRQLDLAGFDTRLLDIGGGFPVEYVQPIAPIDQFCAPIRRALDRHIRPGIKVVSEPGRFIAASPVTLVCSIIGKASRDGKVWYYLDDGLYSTFSGIVYDHCQYPVITSRSGPGELSVLAGPTCDSFDVMYDGLMIPSHQVGDRILFSMTGAYCHVSGSGFNGLKRPTYTVIN